jgi:hypothetical protein
VEISGLAGVGEDGDVPIAIGMPRQRLNLLTNRTPDGIDGLTAPQTAAIMARA